MDLATILKDYSTLITAVIGIIGIVLTYFFTRGHYVRSRKWELEDREYKRGVEIHDKKIQAARDYIDTLHETLHVTGDFIYVLKNRKILTETDDTYLRKLAGRLAELTDLGGKQSLSIDALNDEELKSLHEVILSKTFHESKFLIRTAEEFLHGQRTEFSMKKLEEVENTYAIAESGITVLRQKIDILALKVT